MFFRPNIDHYVALPAELIKDKIFALSSLSLSDSVLLVVDYESGDNKEQDESAQKDKRADRTFLCTSCVLCTPPPPPLLPPFPSPAHLPPDLCHDSGFSLIECGGWEGGGGGAGHVLTRGQSQSAPRGQSLSRPCKFMTA